MHSSPYRIAIITLSDRVAAGTREDESGTTIRAMIASLAARLISQTVLPDDAGQLANQLVALADEEHADLILTTGGTGLGPRDVTPEATLSVIDKRVLGIEETLRATGVAKTPFAMLSRAVAGIRGRTLIVNLPGSPKAVRESLEVLVPVLPHALALLREGQVPDQEHQFND